MSWKATASVKDLRKDAQGKRLTPSEKCLLYTLADYYDEEKGYAWPSMERLAEESMLSERQAVRLVRDLEGRGILSVERRKNDTSVYRFSFGKYAKLDVPAGDKLSPPPGDTHDTSGVTPRASRGDIAVSPKPPLTVNEPEKTLNLLPPEEMAKNDPILRVWNYYHRLLGRGKAYTLTDARRKKGETVFKHALKTANGNVDEALLLMKLAVDNLKASKWHVEGGYVSWEKNLFPSVEKFEEWIDPMEKGAA